MSISSDNRALVRAGLARNIQEADGLRKRVAESDQSVSQYILAQAQSTSLAGNGIDQVEPSKANELLELKVLMAHQDLSYVEARVLKGILDQDGISIPSYLSIERAESKTPVLTGPVGIFRAAGKLIELAGSASKAIEAINTFSSLSGS